MARRRHRRKIPNTIVEAEIHGLSHDGRGITQVEGKTVFVSNALPNEKVKFEYTQCFGKYDEAKAIEILQPSTERVEPKCAHFGICGGCSLQHMHPHAQRQLKQQTLLQQLAHFGHCQPDVILPPLFAEPWHYRLKARLGVRYVHKKQTALVGFREKQSNFIAELQGCEVLHQRVSDLINPLKALITGMDAKQTIPQIEVAVDDQQVALIFRHLESLSEHDQQCLRQFSQQHGLHCYLQPEGIASIHLFYPEQANPLLSYNFTDYNLRQYFMPSDFSQVNQGINKQMIGLCLQLLEPQAQDTILDLYCGFGNFTLPIAKHCQYAVGVEGSDISVARAKYNAQQNQLSNVDFYCHDLSTDFSEQPWASHDSQHQYDKLVLDPARSGAEYVVTNIEKLNVKRIVYISCNPATLARDAGILTQQKGYRLIKAGIMDMFPHTNHVESIALFERD